MSTTNSFADLQLAQPLLQAIDEEGYTQPTPIQAKAIPEVLAGHDLMAAAQTGTGKTAGFTLPILQHLLASGAGKSAPGRPKVLILTPTRELAAQVQESVRTYGRHTRITSMVMFGGVNINPQITALKKPVDILVATPGRLLDHVSQKTLNLSDVSVLVLDEADRMLDMGFIRDIRKILALLPVKRQNLLFSATFSDDIRQLARGVLHNPVEVSVNPPNTTAQRVEQTVHLVPQSDKRDVLSHIIRESGWHQVLVFTRTKHGANRLAERLVKDGLQAAAIHGNKSQAARTRALEGFKTGKVSVLVATDIAARGLDIDQLPQVVNFELPNVPEDYVHRIGRTGRAGAAGCALSLVDQDEMKYLKAIERLTRQPIEQKPAPTGWVRRVETEAPRPPRPQRPQGTSQSPSAGRPGSNRPRSAQPGKPAASGVRSGQGNPASANAGRRRTGEQARAGHHSR